MRGEFVDVGGVRLYYYAAGTRGAGEPVVFLHGFPCSGHLWSDVVAQMPAGHRLVVVDLLGYGRSDPPGTRTLTLRAHAERVVGLMDALGIPAACLVGHGLGGGVAQALCLDWPARVSRLGLVNSVALNGWPPRGVRIVRALLPLARLVPANWLLPIARTELERGYNDPMRATHSIDKYQRPFHGDEGRPAFWKHVAALDWRETQSFAARLGEIAVPTAVVSGPQDPFLKPSLARRLVDAIRDATLDVVADGRHFTPEESPRQIAEIIAALLVRTA